MRILAVVAICMGGLLGAGLVGWGLTAMLRRYLDVSRSKAALVLLFSVLTGLGALVICHLAPEAESPILRQGGGSDVAILTALCRGVFTALLLVFLVKLHSKWIAGRLSEAEKQPGLQGVRAWLGAADLGVVVVLALLAWLAFDYSPVGVAVLGVLALLAYPGLVSLVGYLQAPLPAGPQPSERQRVLSMLDSGKITTAECAELLNALNYTEQPRVAQAGALTVPRKLVLVGTALLVLGFFLPWFSFNPPAEVSRVAQNLPFGVNWSGMVNNGLPVVSVRVSGSDVQHGLGWMVLLLSLGVAALPYLGLNLSEQARQRVTLGALCAGAVILLYLMTHHLRFVSYGLLLALIGYGLQVVGTVPREWFGAQRTT